MKSVKNPWEHKVSKRAEEAQDKQMGQGCPREKGTQEPIGKKAYGSVKPLGKEYMAGQKGAQQDQVITAGMIGHYDRT